MIGSVYRRMQGVLKRRTDINLQNLRYNQERPNPYGFIVLLPEVDPELADKLLSINDELPAFSQITTEKIGTLMGKHIVDYECAVRNTDRNLEEIPNFTPDLFEDALNPLEKTINTFDTIWGIFRTLYLCDRNTVPPNVYYSLTNRIMHARATLYNTDCLFEACKKCDKSKLSEEQTRYVDKLILEGHLNGLDASPKNRGLIEFSQGRISEEGTLFRLRTEAARSQFFITIEDALLVQEVPRYILRKMSHIGEGSVDGPWTIKLHYGVGEKYLEYCPDRDIRFMIWHAEDKAASLREGIKQLANSVCLEDIRGERHMWARKAGYKNFFEANLATKMAGTVDNIVNTLNAYLKIAKPVQYNEIVKLQELAYNHSISTPIQLWDVPYWGRKQKRMVYNFDDELLRPYLPLDRVLSGLFTLCTKLFDIRIEEVKGVDRWHPDVRFYYVYEPEFEKPVAGFYFDPYLRDTKMQATSDFAIVTLIRSSSSFPRRVMPLAALTMYLEAPTEKIPSLLSFSEAKELFAKLGYCLQHILNKSSYSELAGLNFVEFDAIETVQKFMENWIYDKNVFKSISQHYDTGDPAPAIDLEGVRKHLAGYRLCKELFKARMDIEMHLGDEKFWHDIATDLWDSYFIFPMSKNFSEPCRYIDIFSDKWAGAYYSHIWAEMLAADIHLAFAEESEDATVGARFRDTFLSFGGSCHAGEVFRRFRGRDPDPHILMQHLGLTDELKRIEEGHPDPKLIATC